MHVFMSDTVLLGEPHGTAYDLKASGQKVNVHVVAVASPAVRHGTAAQQRDRRGNMPMNPEVIAS